MRAREGKKEETTDHAPKCLQRFKLAHWEIQIIPNGSITDLTNNYYF